MCWQHTKTSDGTHTAEQISVYNATTSQTQEQPEDDSLMTYQNITSTSFSNTSDWKGKQKSNYL